MSYFRQFTSYNNLVLAWNRLRTADNVWYKNYYRTIFDAYNLALEDNLRLLSQSLKDSTYQPTASVRLMIPKNSGLQRSISLLSVEDQIVYQAMANIFAEKLRPRRIKVERNVACSNRLSKHPKDIFFLKKWQINYSLFKNRVYQHYTSGYKHVADFDLTAFYDTISHDLFTVLFSPRGGNQDFITLLHRCLKTWAGNNLSHGIPQGPVASNFLAECILLPIDEAMRDSFKYVRYVDDIRILGMKKIDVQNGITTLEGLCKQYGLIPHSGKFGIRFARSKAEALGKSTSLAVNTTSTRATTSLYKSFFTSLNKRRNAIVDATLFKYILYRVGPNEKILTHVLRLLPNYPDLIDVFIFYLQQFGRRRKIAHRLINLLRTSTPYEYVEGQYWKLLSLSGSHSQLHSTGMYTEAIDRLVNTPIKSVPIKLGLYSLLGTSANTSILRPFYKSLVRDSNFIVKANIFPEVSTTFPTPNSTNDLLRRYLESSHVEPSIVAAWYVGIFGISWSDISADASKIPRQSVNILNKLHVLPRTTVRRVDSIGTILSRRFRLPPWNKWKTLLEDDYKHAHMILVMSENAFKANPSTWMGCIDSFNDHVIRHVINYLTKRYPAKTFPKTVNTLGQLVDYGKLLDPNSYLGTTIPTIQSPFYDFHKRRNSLPTSHAKDKKTQKHNLPLKRQEQTQQTNSLATGYASLITFLSSHGL